MRFSKNRKIIAVAAVLIVAAALLCSKDQRLFKLSLTVPEKGLIYDFNDNTFQEWVCSSSYIMVENGRIKASAVGSGGTQTYPYNFDTDFEGWTEYTWDSSDNVVATVKKVSIMDQAAKFYVRGYISSRHS